MIQFINIETDKVIDRFFKIRLEIAFKEDEEITIEGISYKYVKKSTAFYRDSDGEKMVTNIYLQK